MTMYTPLPGQDGKNSGKLNRNHHNMVYFSLYIYLYIEIYQSIHH